MMSASLPADDDSSAGTFGVVAGSLYGGAGASPSADSGFSGGSAPGGSADDLTNGAQPVPTPEEKAELEQELAKVDDEIRTLRQVLQAKLRRANDLKRSLGITHLDEIKSDLNTTLKTIQESEAYVKTSTTLKTAGQKTGEALSTAGTSLRGKLGEMRNSPSFQSLGASVGSTWGSLKRQVSNSMRPSQSADDFSGAANGGASGSSYVERGMEAEAALPSKSDP